MLDLKVVVYETVRYWSPALIGRMFRQTTDHGFPHPFPHELQESWNVVEILLDVFNQDLHGVVNFEDSFSF